MSSVQGEKVGVIGVNGVTKIFNFVKISKWFYIIYDVIDLDKNLQMSEQQNV